MFVMDASSSVPFSNFVKMKEFVSDLVGDLNVNSTSTRVGIVSHSSNFVTSMDLNEQLTDSGIQQELDGFRFGLTWGDRNTGNALEHVRELKLTTGAGDRTDVANVVVVFTFGVSINSTKIEVWCKI